jgi:uncharacterized protein (TIGR00251 family)
MMTASSKARGALAAALYAQAGDELLLHLHVQPGAKKNRVVGLHDGRLKLAVAAPPVDGKANAQLLAFLAKLLGLRKNQLQLRSGQSGRQKTLAVTGISLDRLQEVLVAQLRMRKGE